MNRSELISMVATRTGRTRSSVAEILDDALAIIVEQVTEGSHVTISRFGRFEKRVRPAGFKFNPTAGKPIQIAQSSRITFTPSATLLQDLNKEKRDDKV